MGLKARILGGLSLVALASLSAIPAQAQSLDAEEMAADNNDAAAQQPATRSDAGEDNSDENVIVITASKRSENLQNVPISVSAIGGDALANARVNMADELVTKVPNLQLSGIVGENVPIFSLRGISMFDYSLNQSSPVATYYDEVYKGNFALLGVAMYDLERVEVLRGPQGTLYGKNTTGGAVNLISRRPSLGEFNGYLNGGYGNYDRIDVNGALNVPIGDTLAVRVAGTFARADGWFKNVLPGKPDLQSTREWAARASILWEPSPDLQFILRGSTSFQNPWNYGIYAQPDNVNRPGLKRREIASNATERRRARTYSASLTANYDFTDTMTLTSITSWDEGKLFYFEDTDGQAIELLEIPYFADTDQFAQDLRLTSDFAGPFNFILGAYYNREKVFNSTTFQIGTDIDFDGNPGVTAADCAIGLPLACHFANSFTQIKNSYALYSDMSYDLTDALTLRGGIRYTHDKGVQKDFVSDVLGPDGVLVANLIPLTNLSYKTDNVSGKAGIDYTTLDGHLLYASYSRGYRANSFNAQAFFDPSEVSVSKPEKVNAYEIGAKMQFLGNDITLNMAAFYYDYKNQQFINVDPVSAAQTLLNIPKSRIVGGEIEFTGRITDFLTLRGSMGLLDTEIRRGTVSGVDVSGNQLANAPRVSFSGGLDLTLFDSSAGKLSAHGDVSYASDQYFEVVNIQRLEQGAYALLSGHIDWESADGHWRASVWAKNLTNHFYFNSRVDLLGGFGFDYNHVGTPRTYGVSAGFRF